MSSPLPDWLDPTPWLTRARAADRMAVDRALDADQPDIVTLATLLSPAAADRLEPMAQRAQALTRRHFGRTLALYVPLYLSDYCSSGCAYCGFAADRPQPRRRLESSEIAHELRALKQMGFEEILLLTGERTPEADFDYLRAAVRLAAASFHLVTIEAFPMSADEYRHLATDGCTGVTVYQETYDPEVYRRVHPHGPKADYAYRLETPARALTGGLRTAGLGILLGLHDPVFDALCLYRHLVALRRQYWQAGFSVAFPRLRPQRGDFTPPHPVGDRMLAQLIYAFRICLPDVPLVLSTREAVAFRDGLAGVGINKMSVASRTTVGGYHSEAAADGGQFQTSDRRDVAAFCAALKAKGLEPVFKNWDSVYRSKRVPYRTRKTAR